MVANAGLERGCPTRHTIARATGTLTLSLLLVSCAPSCLRQPPAPPENSTTQSPIALAAQVTPCPEGAHHPDGQPWNCVFDRDRLGAGTPSAPTVTPRIEAAADPHAAWLAWLATRPRDMESYGFVYDPAATPDLPPQDSVGMPIWGQHLPLRAFDRVPRFIAYPTPLARANTEALLTQAGCVQASVWTIECTPGSPLADLGCEEFWDPKGYYPGLDPDLHVLALCLNGSEDSDEESDTRLYRLGCAFRRDVSFILESEGEYTRISTPEQLKPLLIPIDSPEKALTYAVMRTGLSATFSFEREPDLLYFQDPVEGTRVTQSDGVYTMNLFHYMECLCEPYVHSEVYLSVDRQGEIAWLNAVPWSMTIGLSCGD